MARGRGRQDAVRARDLDLVRTAMGRDAAIACVREGALRLQSLFEPQDSIR